MQTPAQIVKKIKSVKVQGAKEIALYSLKYLRKFCEKNGFGLKFEVVAMMLENARPTAVVLHNCLEILKKEKKLKTIDKLIKELENSSKKIAIIGQKIIRDGQKILTHCHSGEALGIIKEAARQGKKISVYATITEPLKQGIRTAKELAKEKIPVTLAEDIAVGHLMHYADIVIVGSDAMRKEGFVNKVGTWLIAEEAKRHKKPFYVVGSHFKFDSRKKLVLEERPVSEILLKPIKGVKVRNPAFDLVPWNYVTAVITDKGIFKPEKIKEMIR
ncbi:MAG: S-methyl-5-thioribose-1-phosphate isomerase [Candidatus Aenigmatarchaeota archaeon]